MGSLIGVASRWLGGVVLAVGVALIVIGSMVGIGALLRQAENEQTLLEDKGQTRENLTMVGSGFILVLSGLGLSLLGIVLGGLGRWGRVAGLRKEVRILTQKLAQSETLMEVHRPTGHPVPGAVPSPATMNALEPGQSATVRSRPRGAVKRGRRA